MQKHALEALLLQTLVELEIPVFVVPRDGMPLAGQVHADLVRAAGLDRHLQHFHLRRAPPPAAAGGGPPGAGQLPRGRTRVMERMPCGSSAVVTRTRRSPSACRYL